jgi:tetratricopeptide (TPR) repeat protein
VKIGSLVADRFAIGAEIGAGGMGTVYRANDRQTGSDVALKVIHATSADLLARFEREARVLARLDHPAIVRYVAHGVAPEGPWLAMEWLDGEDLAARLSREALSVADTLVLLRRVAGALAALHARGGVHRDIKPSNLHLRGGDPDSVKLLDFGIVRVTSTTFVATSTGVALGTIGYMAPEQVRGDVIAEPSADIFALGCVAFECLTRRAAFAGEHAIGVLAKILFEEAPRLRAHCSDVPDALDELVARMLSKEREARPATGAALLAALDNLGSLDRGPVVRASLRPSLTASEQRTVSVVMAKAGGVADPLGNTVDADHTALREVAKRAVRAAGTHAHARVEMLADGTLIATLQAATGTTLATDQAAHAARYALALRQELPEVHVVLATGRAVVGSSALVGDVIDRAAALLRASTSASVRLDEVSAALLSARFEVHHDAEGPLLAFERGEREQMEGSRMLLGRPTPFVGRQRELAALTALFEECVDESMSRAVLVTAAAGMGKSRLRQEFLHALEGRGAVDVWIGRGDPMRLGAAFGIVAPALRSAAGILDGEPTDESFRKLELRVARSGLLDASDAERVTDFLGELIGVEAARESASLRAARRDPILMGDQMRRAWEDFVAAECRTHPVILVLEDLHWGDLPSIELVSSALRSSNELPFFVVALARPEVHDAFPKLWSERDAQEIRLGGLTKRAAEQLVREVLGDVPIDTQVLERTIERAEGNVFYLEELIRAAAEGRGGRVPDTVLAMVQTRLEALGEDERRVLRAASIFGERFWRGGVDALVGDEAIGVTAVLKTLVEREIVGPGGESRFADEREYGFRHALVREGAYAMLTDDDRSLGHKLAAGWLEESGERNAIVLARHFEEGRDLLRAAGQYLRAAEEALEGNDLVVVIERAERGIACGAQGDTLARLHLAKSDASAWRGNLADAEASAIAAAPDLAAGSLDWCRALHRVVEAARLLGHRERMFEYTERLAVGLLTHGLSEPGLVALSEAARALNHSGAWHEANAFMARFEEPLRAFVVDGPRAASALHEIRAIQAQQLRDHAAVIRERSAAIRYLDEIGDRRRAARLRQFIAYSSLRVGSPTAITAGRDAIAAAEELGLEDVANLGRHNLGLALARHGQLEEAQAVEMQAVDAYARTGNRTFEAFSRGYLADIAVLRGDLEVAEQEARRALAISTQLPAIHPFAKTTLARVLLLRGRPQEALDEITPVLPMLDSFNDEAEEQARLVHAEALDATGDHDGARASIVDARTRLLERASRISDVELRRSFLENVPQNARTLELAKAWIG